MVDASKPDFEQELDCCETCTGLATNRSDSVEALENSDVRIERRGEDSPFASDWVVVDSAMAQVNLRGVQTAIPVLDFVPARTSVN